MHNFKKNYHLNLEGTPTGESYPAIAWRGNPLTTRAHTAVSRPRRPLTPLHARHERHDPRHEGGAPRLQIQNQREHESGTSSSTTIRACLLPPCLGLLPRPPLLRRLKPGPHARVRGARGDESSHLLRALPAAGRRCKLPRPLPAQTMSTSSSCRIFFFDFFSVAGWCSGARFPRDRPAIRGEYRSDEARVPRCIRRLRAGFVKARSRGARRRWIWVRVAVFAGFGVGIWGQLRVCFDLFSDRR
jgi:hypothetical protein